MSGSTFEVRPGAAQQLTGTSQAVGSVIVNNDTANAVWISSEQAVTPGNGIFVAPLATATWAGKQLWACVDTGVLTPIQIVVSNDITQVDNPVAVATAVAIALLSQGIPNVLVSTIIETNLRVNQSTSSADIPVTAYSELTVTVNNALNLGTGFTGYLLFKDAAGGFVEKVYFQSPNNSVPPSSDIGFLVPATGATVAIVNTCLDAINVWMTGTNRPRTQISAASASKGVANGALSTTNGVIQTVFKVQTAGKNVQWSIDTNFTCTFGYYFYDDAGAQFGIILGNIGASGGLVFGETIVPLGITEFWIDPFVTLVGTGQLTVSVVGQQ